MEIVLAGKLAPGNIAFYLGTGDSISSVKIIHNFLKRERKQKYQSSQ